MFTACVLAASFVQLAASAPLDPSVQPVIGILTMPPNPNDDKIDVSYVRITYPSYLESGGAVVTPIYFNSTKQEIEEQFHTLSGIFFTGGPSKPTDFHRYFATEQLLLSLALEYNQPVWGTCLGFQSIADIIAGEDILGDYEAENVELALNLTPAAESSRLFGKDSMSDEIRDLFTERNYTTNWHYYGVGVDVFDAHLAIPGKDFVATSTNVDINGVEFVSTMEHATKPIYATQWHPEANAFSYDHDTVDHSPDAVRAMQYMANFFVKEAREKGLGPGNVDWKSKVHGPGVSNSNIRTFPVGDTSTGLSYVFK
jgi:gamma-glutamyl hydrolase